MFQSILLINPSMQAFYKGSKVKDAITRSPPLNIAVVAGALERAGYQVRALDLNGEVVSDRQMERLIASTEPDMIGFTFRTPVFGEARRLARLARRVAPHALIVAGGVHPSVMSHEVVEDGAFDVAVINEGDETILDLAKGRPFDEIAGIAYLKDGVYTANPARAPVQDLDSLAFPAWRLFDIRRYSQRSLVARHPPVVDLESSRGCPAHCIYCTRSLFGEGFRAKSPSRVVDEVENALSYGFHSFNLVDDSFTTDLKRAVGVCEELKRRGLSVPWTLTNGIRVSHTDDAFFRTAAASGLEIVAFGLETGAQKLLNAVGKGATLNQARRAVSSARKHGITTLGYFMVGLPGENSSTLEATLEFARELDLDYAKFSITVPLPGTELFELWRNYIDESSYHQFNIHHPSPKAFKNPDISWDEIERYLKRAYRSFYLRPQYIKKRLLRDIREGQFLYNLRLAASMSWN